MSDQNLGENGSPQPTPPIPRIAPPEGQRLARGQKMPESENIAPAETVPEPLAGDESVLQSVAVESSAVEAQSPLDSEYSGFEFSMQSDAQLDETAFANAEESRFRHSTLREDTPKDKELGLLDHLNELRVRLMWCFAIVGIGMAVTWNQGLRLQEWFVSPIVNVLKGKGILISRGPTDFFTIYLEFSLASAVILTAPFLFLQVWKFIEPALTNSERRYTLVLVPFSSILFFLGAGLGYLVSPLFFKFFLAFQPPGVAADWDYYASLMLMAKMLLVFGVAFQVPIIIIFGVKIGLLTRDILIQYWRHAVIVIFTVIAVLTPTWDPLTLAICAAPPCLLYVLSIWFVKWM